MAGRTSDTIAHITPIRNVNDEGKGKKHALHLLIHATEADVLWLHDDDITLPTAADAEALVYLGDADLLILPLRMVKSSDTLIQRLQIIEYAALQALTVRMARKGKPILCSGANMIVKRDVWLQAEPYLHPDLPSGDDMFLLEYCKRTGRTIAVCDVDSMTATVTAQPTLRALLRQRARWAGKAPHYTDRDIRCYGALVTIALVLQFICPPMVLLYLPFECSLIRGKGFAPLEVLLLAIIYPYYALIALIGGLLHPKRW
ncbi:MAG: glycosyltransferase [Paludibacteraceae bacterium]|nr:glycosyltransferase [Paludibacteraceae bacterium]